MRSGGVVGATISPRPWLVPMAVAILLFVAGFRMGARVLINQLWY